MPEIDSQVDDSKNERWSSEHKQKTLLYDENKYWFKILFKLGLNINCATPTQTNLNKDIATAQTAATRILS
jgi:hypothetical protein